MITKTSEQLTLKDRLSRLTYIQACKLLGPDGARWIQVGGQREIDITAQVYFRGDLFRLSLHEAIVTITLMAEARNRLHVSCTACDGVCEHMGAALSLLLEEKTALGLAAPPPERVPVESLSEAELVEQALQERRQRAREERMRLQSTEPGKLWTDYTVTNPASGKTYRVSLRGWERGESYCSCPDFRKNTLGTCKHILHIVAKLRRRFPASVCNKPYRRKHFGVHVRYEGDAELRLLLPASLDAEAEKIVRPLRDRPIDDVRGLLRRIRKLEELGEEVIIYPDAQELMEQRLLQGRLESLVAEIRKSPARHPLRKTLLKTELLPYQLDGVAFAAGAGRAILADDMGLGKTIQGVGVAELLAREAGVQKVLVVCPASLKSQWRDEIRRFSGRSCQLVLGSARERKGQYQNESFFTVCNYEQVMRDIVLVEQVPWDLIVLDEAQRIKNWEAKTARVMKGLRSRFALALSGTPLENRLDELFSVVEFIDDRRLGPAFRFFNRHRVVDEKGKVLGYKNLGELRRRLRPTLLRRTRDGVMKQLPPRTTEIIRIPPTEEQAEIDGAQMRVVASVVNKPFITEMDILRLQKALLLARMAADSTYLVYKKEPSYSSKLEELDRLLSSLAEEEGRKIVLFSEWTTMLDLIQKQILDKHGIRYVRLDGSVPQKKRQQIVHQFQTDPGCTLFITTNAGSTGLNLQAANTVVNVDLPWNPAVLEQRIGRAHRMGQKRPVHVFVLVTEETIEEKLLGNLAAKRDLALAALDPDSDVDFVDFGSGMEALKARLEILLGASPEASVDESEKARQKAEAERLAHREQVALAGGQLLNAAFSFLGQMLPATKETPESRTVAGVLRTRLEECMDKDEEGRPRLTVTLPDEAALEGLASALAALLARPGAGGDAPPATGPRRPLLS